MNVRKGNMDMKGNLLLISEKCQANLANKTLEQKQKNCNLMYSELLENLEQYPMENCFDLFYNQLDKDYIFLGIYLACKNREMQYMLNSLYQGNRIGVMDSNWAQTTFDQSNNLIKIILAIACNDMEILGKLMPEQLGIAKNGTFSSHYNMIMAMLYSDFDVGKLAEEQLKVFLTKKQNKFDVIFSRYLIELYNHRLDKASEYLQEMCNALLRVNWVQEDIFFSTAYKPLGRAVALFVHGMYHLAYYYLGKDDFFKIRMPVHKSFIREYEEFNIQNNFPCGRNLIEFDNTSMFMKHFMDIDIIPTVTVMEWNGKKILDAEAFQYETFLNMKKRNLIDFEVEGERYVFKSIW